MSSRPGSGLSQAEAVKASRPTSTTSRVKTRPSTTRSTAWQEEPIQEFDNIEEIEEEEEDSENEGGHHEVEDLGPLVIKGEDDIPKGCWFAFLQSFNGIWSTKDMNDDLDRENSVRTTVRELVIYLLFLMVIVLCMFGGTSSMRYRYTNMMRQHLDEFDKVKQVRKSKTCFTTIKGTLIRGARPVGVPAGGVGACSLRGRLVQ